MPRRTFADHNPDNNPAFVFELDSRDSGYANAFVRVVNLDASNEIRYSLNEDLESLHIEASGTSYSGTREWSRYWEARFHDCYSVRESRAEAMLATLRKLRKGLDKANEEAFGEASTFGQHVARCAKVLGIRQVGFFAPRGGMWASGEKIRFVGLGEAVSYIDSRMRDWADNVS